MAAYNIDIRPRARRSLRQLDMPVRKAVGDAIGDPSGRQAEALRRDAD